MIHSSVRFAFVAFSVLDSLRDHFESSHPEKQANYLGYIFRYWDNYRYTCTVKDCEWTFKRYVYYIYHMEKFHPGVSLGERETEY
ncbi:uncharacterized protein N7496_012345 [Penicillium cataractarum]|uniref:C2H2-type domain-containing protein n=1 Tax=Penicillium cataractarum TaxID=2100454 RepID=A0A9W9URT2_9EURO|nr:uncharacterized protein N7496_012345 [Penicillium cataractarum]KAJ5355133.1 hypothetical protein N7496_012345 [Penicillium cataractarum]